MKINIAMIACLLLVPGTDKKAAPVWPPAILSAAAAAGPGERLSLGCENKGVRLDRIYWTYPEEYGWTQVLRLTNNGKVTRLHSLRELTGLVQIKDGDAALRYVRLQTSPETWNLMHGDGTGEMEIVTPDQAADLPAFGLKGNPMRMDPNAGASKSGFSPVPGLGGVIPRNVYRRGGFAPAQARSVPGGFAVTRWVFTDAYLDGKTGALVKKVREIVTMTGGYRRTILRQERVHLSGAALRLPFYGGE